MVWPNKLHIWISLEKTFNLIYNLICFMQVKNSAVIPKECRGLSWLEASGGNMSNLAFRKALSDCSWSFANFYCIGPINDLPNNLTSTVRLFADNCVIYQTVTSDNDADLLQKDLDQLCLWEKTWLMKCNPEICVVLKVTNTHNPNAGFRLACRYVAWSSLAVSELQPSTATPLWLYRQAASRVE